MDTIIIILAIIGALTVVLFITCLIEKWTIPHQESDYYTLKIKKSPYATTTITINGGEVLEEARS